MSILRPYLETNCFILSSNEEALKWLSLSADASGKLTTWRLRLREFDSEVVHRAGIKYQALDALSRLETEESDNTKLNENLPALTIDDTEEKKNVKMEYFDEDQPETDDPATT